MKDRAYWQSRFDYYSRLGKRKAAERARLKLQDATTALLRRRMRGVRNYKHTEREQTA